MFFRTRTPRLKLSGILAKQEEGHHSVSNSYFIPVLLYISQDFVKMIHIKECSFVAKQKALRLNCIHMRR